MLNTEFKSLSIMTVNNGRVDFKGRYRRDLEKGNWHYYETTDKKIYHFRKEHMMCVFENSEKNMPFLVRDKKTKEKFVVLSDKVTQTDTNKTLVLYVDGDDFMAKEYDAFYEQFKKTEVKNNE